MILLMDIKKFFISLRSFAVQFAGFSAGTFVASRIAKDNWKVRASGQAIGWIAARNLDDMVNKIQDKKKYKCIECSTNMNDSFWVDYADQIKSREFEKNGPHL